MASTQEVLNQIDAALELWTTHRAKSKYDDLSDLHDPSLYTEVATHKRVGMLWAEHALADAQRLLVELERLLMATKVPVDPGEIVAAHERGGMLRAAHALADA